MTIIHVQNYAKDDFFHHSAKLLFRDIQNGEIDFELFKSMKKKLFTDYSDREKLSNGWQFKLNHLSKTG
jgi:hypothetical protein